MIYIATYLRDPSAVGFPSDVGDDPSFAASARYRADGGALTWGVCRQDVRNALRPNDLVVFFAADRLSDRTPARYCFVGFATVERKVTQADIWRDTDLAIYRRYRNLLIERTADGNGFRHVEPETPQRLVHTDWVWRMVETGGHKKGDFDAIQKRDVLDAGEQVGGRLLKLAANYVLFRRESELTFVVANPPVVAEALKPRSVERWLDTEEARVLRGVVFTGTQRSLRTTNPQQAHRHIRIDANESERRRELLDAIRRLGLVRRDDAPESTGRLPAGVPAHPHEFAAAVDRRDVSKAVSDGCQRAARRRLMRQREDLA